MIVIPNKKARTVLRLVTILLIMPLVLIGGAYLFPDKKSAWASFILAIFTVVLFLCSFDTKKTGTRRLVLLSVLTALSVIGRFIPILKPVTAFAVITGMFFGPEAGFLVGSFSALISNFYFGQGPWTPFQMFSWGILGFMAGLLAVPLKKSRIFLSCYAVFSGFAFSFLMDIWTVLWAAEGFTWELYFAKIATALPYTILYAFSNLVFLLLFRKPFGEKFERIKLKYGI